jgi:type I restriction enzyme S subunit
MPRLSSCRRADSCDAVFLFYALSTPEKLRAIAVMAQGAASQANVSPTQVESVGLELPSIQVQSRIASILSAYDDLIENNTRRIKILEEMAQMLYREWFVNLRFPGHEKVKMVESELGPIPEGWSVQTLGELAVITMGQSPPSESYNSTGTGLPFHQGVTDFGARFPTDRTYCTIKNRLAEPLDILMSVRAPVGRLNISTKKIVIGRGLCAIRSRADSQAILYQQLKEHFREEDTMGSGTIFKSVTKQDVHGIKFIRADNVITAGLEVWLKPLFRQLEVLSSKNLNLRQTRDLLLPKLISGEVSVEAAAELMEQTA